MSTLQKQTYCGNRVDTITIQNKGDHKLDHVGDSSSFLFILFIPSCLLFNFCWNLLCIAFIYLTFPECIFPFLIDCST